MDAKQNYRGLDLFRLIAAVLVVAIHTSPLTSFSADADFFAARILSRVAVPFFFMVTGHFVVSGFLNAADADRKWKRYLIKISLYYGIAVLLYLPIGIYAGHYDDLNAYGVFRLLVFDGTFYHLWYFPASIIGVTLVYLMSKRMRVSGMLAAAGVLYLIGLLGDSYFGLIQKVPVLCEGYGYGFHIFSYTRNGLFFAPLFLLLGAVLGSRAIPQNRIVPAAGLAVSFLLMTGEAFSLHALGWQRHDSMYLALIPTMVFLYQLLLHCRGNSCVKLRVLSTWIYILHPAVIVLVHGAAKGLGRSGLLVQQSLIHYLVVTTVSVAAAYLLAQLLDRAGKHSFQSGRAWIELDRNALAQNVQLFRSMLPEDSRLMPAVKAQAYGHGAVLIAKELNRQGVDAFCVASVREAAELRRCGIRGEILILGYTHPEEFPLLRRYRLTQTVIDYDYARELDRYGKKLHVHLGIDTGMHRLGERSENIDRICAVYDMKNLVIDGMFSHLAASDRLTPRDIAFTECQVKQWNRVVCELRRRGYTIPKRHLLGSYGLINYPELAGDYVRVGIALYGVLGGKADTDAWRNTLRPVLSLKARVAAVRELRAKESAGYGIAFTAECDMRIATIAIGYADGLPRSLSCGAGAVLIHGCKAPILGRICMDQTIIDVTDIPQVRTGDIAVLIGSSGAEEISAADLAEQTNSITNEVLSRLGSRLERKMINSSADRQIL